jgi:hypothetical protein
VTANGDGRRKGAPHGTRARYNHRTDPCHCIACREANARYQQSRRNPVRRHPAGVVPVVDKRGKVIGQQPPLFGA